MDPNEKYLLYDHYTGIPERIDSVKESSPSKLANVNAIRDKLQMVFPIEKTELRIISPNITVLQTLK